MMRIQTPKGIPLSRRVRLRKINLNEFSNPSRSSVIIMKLMLLMRVLNS